MKNEEKKSVGSLLGQKVLEDEDTVLEKLYVGCVGIVLVFFYLYYFLLSL